MQIVEILSWSLLAKMKRSPGLWISLIGALLLAGSLVLFWPNTPDPAAISVPQMIASLSLSMVKDGPEAVAEITRLHQKNFEVKSGAMGMYGKKGEINVWVAGFSSSAAATPMMNAMREKIAAGGSPFTPVGTRQILGRSVYELNGMGQKHFYFQSGVLVIWLAANSEIAEQALAEILRFYP